MNRRRVVTINDGVIGMEESISVARMYCSGAPYMAVRLVDCLYRTKGGVTLYDKNVCIGCGYCSYAYPFSTSQSSSQGTLGVHGKMDRCTSYAGGPEKSGNEEEFEKYGRSRLAEGKPPLYAGACSTKALLGGDGDVISDILRNRVTKRGKDAELFGRGMTYGGTQGRGGQAAPATPAASAKPVSTSGVQS